MDPRIRIHTKSHGSATLLFKMKTGFKILLSVEIRCWDRDLIFTVSVLASRAANPDPASHNYADPDPRPCFYLLYSDPVWLSNGDLDAENWNRHVIYLTVFIFSARSGLSSISAPEWAIGSDPTVVWAESISLLHWSNFSSSSSSSGT